jgi:hypothetical protein
VTSAASAAEGGQGAPDTDPVGRDDLGSDNLRTNVAVRDNIGRQRRAGPRRRHDDHVRVPEQLAENVDDLVDTISKRSDERDTDPFIDLADEPARRGRSLQQVLQDGAVQAELHRLMAYQSRSSSVNENSDRRSVLGTWPREQSEEAQEVLLPLRRHPAKDRQELRLFGRLRSGGW